MKISLERTGRWFDFIKRIAREENAPEEIAHLAIVESGLNPNAFSRARAVGMWQFMQPTGEEYDLNVTYWIDERRDPEKSTRAAMRFLKDLSMTSAIGSWHWQHTTAAVETFVEQFASPALRSQIFGRSNRFYPAKRSNMYPDLLLPHSLCPTANCMVSQTILYVFTSRFGTSQPRLQSPCSFLS